MSIRSDFNQFPDMLDKILSAKDYSEHRKYMTEFKCMFERLERKLDGRQVVISAKRHNPKKVPEIAESYYLEEDDIK